MKLPYLNFEEVETKLEIAAETYPHLCELITLPNATHEGRTSHVLRIGARTAANPTGLLFIGGVHAREWGSSDILIFFLETLLEARETGMGVTFGNVSYSGRTVRAIVDCLDIFIFPDVNPDGKYYSQNTYNMWRKNRGPTPNPGCKGTDLNRNYGFLWDFRTHMHPDAGTSVSDYPCDFQVYRGPAPFSEPETTNVKWLLDQYPNIQYFVDVHSYGELILIPWGDDQNQTNDPEMGFRNAVYDGQRGIKDDMAYREYSSGSDWDTHKQLATWMQTALQAVRGKFYTVQQAFSLYPTTGVSQDYTFSRHIVDASKKKVYSFTIEWGDWAGGFQPDYGQMTLIMQDVSAALTELSHRVRGYGRPAPTFSPGNWFVCAMRYLGYILLLVLLPLIALFIGKERAVCMLRRARFQVAKCSEGNEDPCIKLSKSA